MKRELTIKEVMDILSITYPTALGYANQCGRFVPDIPPRGQWFIPYDEVKARVDAVYYSAERARERLSAISE